MGLLDRIREGTYVPDADPVPSWAPGSTTTSLVETAKRIAAGEEVMSAVRDFLDQVGWVPDEELGRLVQERPGPTGSAEGDALLAGLAEHFAATLGFGCPAWAGEPDRFLERFWFVSTVPGFRAIALAQTPVALKRRGIFWPERSLRRV